MNTHSSNPSLKRAADVALALILAILTAPVLLVVMVLVRLTSPGPVIYSQTRMGLGRRLFPIFKVRTMYHDCERLSGPQWSTDNDPRITAVGRFLRRSHLDELPQLWNVLRGEMSLVGPRPERPEFITQLEKAVPSYSDRLQVLPGVTGLAQLNHPPDVDHNSVRRKLVADLYYVAHVGLWFDFRILLGTGMYLLGLPRGTTARLLGLNASAADDRPARSLSAESEPSMERVAQALSACGDS